MTEMFWKFDNLPENYIPDNHSRYICGENKCYATIVRGTTPRHSFCLPYDLVQAVGEDSGDIVSLVVTYKQGLNIVLEKTEKYIQYIDDKVDENGNELDDNECIIYFTLTQEETNLFKPTNPNNLVEVQIKIMLSGEDVLVTPLYFMQVLDSLHNEVIGEKEEIEEK